jgi:iron complex transport system substrate-binding protein
MRPKIPAVIVIVAAFLASAGAIGAEPSTAAVRSSTFPVVVQSGDGAVHIPSRPTRILSLSASATQMLYAIGAGSQVVGVDKYSTYPANAPRTTFTGYETSAEAYLSKRPDLVILAYGTGTVVAQLQKLDIPTLLLPPATSIADSDAQITELGTATGHASGARATIASLAADLTTTARNVGTRAKGATYYVEIDQTYYSATSKTFIGALFSRFGMVNIADAASKTGSAYPQLSAEYVEKSNPEYVFLADTICCGQSPKSFGARPGFGELRAVRDGHVIGVNDSVASQWGPHSLESFVAEIAKAIKPESSSHLEGAD